MATHEEEAMRLNDPGIPRRRRSTCKKTFMLLLGVLVGIAQPLLAFGTPPDHAKAVFFDGEVTLIHIDEVIPEQSRFVYFLHTRKAGTSDYVLEMVFEGIPPKHLHTGKKVKIKGYAANGKVWVSEVSELDGDNSSSTTPNTAASATTGDRKTITFVINMDGADYAAQGATPYTQTHVDQSGAAMHAHDQFSVNSAYEEASFGQVTFSGSSLTDVFLVSIPYDSSESCAYRTIASQADAASPVSLQGYQHKMYVVPPQSISGCSWLALGEVGSYGSSSVRKSWSTKIDPIAFAHELGHNIGWHHAATDPDNDELKNVEYGDTSDLMGYCCSKRKLNSVHVDQVGWFDRADLQEKIIDVTGAGQYSLSPLGTDPDTSTYPQIVRITPSTGRPYYLSYRQRTGLDTGLSSTYTTGVNIHRGVDTDNWSYLIKVLKSDFSDPSSYEFHDSENGITISQIENNANYVTVDVSFHSCIAHTPSVSLTPSTQIVGDPSAIHPFMVTITNTDTLGCMEAQLSLNGTFPSGVTGTFQDSVLTVAPGTSATTTMTVMTTNSGDASYPLIVTTSGENPTHDTIGNASVTVDTTAPTTPSNVSASLSGKKQNQTVQLTWDAASDGPQGSGIASYSVYRNGTLIGSASNLNFSDKNFSTTTDNHYDIYAVDQVGHVSTTPGTASYTYSGGSTKPGSGKGRN
ncbi:MAG: hypothetical protein MRJ96_05635 [Nitrospirales bacterium]|nr:hypothetical protein [Nitrospira sp.]MDR4500915.1 hypothetical protein [Nitrospirales bacterium]